LKIKNVLTSRAQKSVPFKVKRQDKAVAKFRDTRGDFYYPKEMAAVNGLKSLPKSHRDYEYREQKQQVPCMLIQKIQQPGSASQATGARNEDRAIHSALQ